MYLLICSKYQLARFDLIFKHAKCNYQTLSLFDVEFDEEMIVDAIHNISNYQQVIVSSELLAQRLIEVFKQHDLINYIAVGKSSADYLIANGIKNVTYPNHSSGIQAVLDSRLIKDNARIMYLTCYKDTYLDTLNSVAGLDTYPLYRHKTIQQDNDKIKNIILNQDLKGIIITSKKFVVELFSQGAKLGLENNLIKQSYIVIHESIKDKLVTLGASKIQLSRNISQIADLLG